MEYYLKVYLDNAAFGDAPGPELARILRSLADDVEGYAFDVGPISFPVRDINGNRVGTHGYR